MRVWVILFSVLCLTILIHSESFAAEPAYIVIVKGQITQAPLPCSAECNPESPDFDGPNPDLPVGTGFEITYWFDTIPEKSFEMATARDYEGVANVELKFGSNVVYEGQSVPVRIFVNNNDDYYYDTFEIENKSVENLSGDGDEIYQFDFRVSDQANSMLNSLDLPSDSDFFSKNTETETIFGFVGGKQAIGALTSITINGENQKQLFSDINFELTPNEITITKGSFVQISGELIIANYDESFHLSEIDVTYDCTPIDIQDATFYISGSRTFHSFEVKVPEEEVPGVYDCLFTANTPFANEPSSQEVVFTVKEATDNMDNPPEPCPVGGCLTFDDSDDNDLECQPGYEVKDGVCTIIIDELENDVDLEIYAIIDQFDSYADNLMLDAVVYTEFVTITNLGDETAKNVRVTGDVTTPNSEFFGVNQFDGNPLYYQLLDMFGVDTIFSENPPEGMITISDCSFSPQNLSILCYLGDLEPHEQVTLYTGVIVYEPLGKTIGRIYEVKSDTSETRYDNNVWREENSPTITGSSWFVETYFAQQDCPECAEQKDNLDTAVTYSPPEWFKTNAIWFADGLIGMDEMINAITNLFEQNIIPLPPIQDQKPAGNNENEPSIPEYTKTVFQYWGGDQVSDDEIGNHLKYLVGIGVIDSPKIQKLKEKSTYPTIANFYNWDLALNSNFEKKEGLNQLLVIKNYEETLFGENSDYLWNEYSQTKDKTIMDKAQKSDFLEEQAREEAKIIVDTLKEVDESIDTIKNLPDIDRMKFDDMQNEYENSKPESFEPINENSKEKTVNQISDLYFKVFSHFALAALDDSKIMLDLIEVSIPDWEPEFNFHPVLDNGIVLKFSKEDIQKALSNNKGELHQYFQPKFSGFTIGNSDIPKASIVLDPKSKISYSFIGYNLDKKDFAANLVMVVPAETSSDETWHIDINLGRVENYLLNPNLNLPGDEGKNLTTIMDEIEKTLVID